MENQINIPSVVKAPVFIGGKIRNPDENGIFKVEQDQDEYDEGYEADENPDEDWKNCDDKFEVFVKRLQKTTDEYKCFRAQKHAKFTDYLSSMEERNKKMKELFEEFLKEE
jgi:hypothetical protein